MRQSTIKQPKLAINHIGERGFTLVMVMGVMMIIAIMVIAGAQISNTEMRMSANEADRKYAFSIAEETMRLAEKQARLELQEYLPPMTRKATSDYKASGWRDYPQVLTQLLEKGPEMVDAHRVFVNDCTGGLCAPAVVIDGRQYGGDPRAARPAWERENVLTGDDGDKARTIEGDVLNNMGLSGDAVAKLPRYIIEFLGRTRDGVSLCRITVRAWGQNANTAVTLQSYVRISYDIPSS